MKLRPAITITTLILAMAGTGLARTWTSADGKDSFEGEFIRGTDTQVTVKREKGTITFDIEKLSADDQAFIKKEVKRAAAIAATSKFKSGSVPKGITDKLKKLNGKSLESAPLSEVTPEYYFLAYTASW